MNSLLEVRLLSISPEYLKNIWTAARTCYSAQSPIEISDTETTEQEQLRLARHIINSGHHSVLEHCHMTFAVKNVSRTLLAQYSRHRIGISLSVQSQRYVTEQSGKNPEGIFDFVLPPSIEKSPEAKKMFLEAMESAQSYYDKLLALEMPKEDARFVLPGGAGTNFVTSLNLRSFLDIYKKRVLTKGAQWEIKELLDKMADILLEKEPWLKEFIDKD
ncbi:FAD-dependent thymidylate synthase [Selenomonadales bacterium OttesenSCG-928-I06]|nr:FAD-dependent thymidylate synthase [Selenomonadales bacterium OttesenSCG-928-I06]